MSVEKLLKAFPGAKRSDIEQYYDGIVKTFEKFEINTVKRQAAFLAQCAHESANFSTVKENLNYSKEALVKVFPKYFPKLELADHYHRDPEKIANRVYANRMGNGDEASGDGWKFRGRGFIQVTGKNNYTACGDALGLGLGYVIEPFLLEDSPAAVLSAGWFWDKNGLNKLADNDEITNITKRINGGTNGLDDRKAKYRNALMVLNSLGKI